MNKFNIDEIKKLYINDNLSMQDIAKIKDTSYSTIYRFLNKHHVKKENVFSTKKYINTSIKNGSNRKGYKMTKEEKEKMIQAVTKYKNENDIGHKKKRKDGYIYLYMPKHKTSNKDGYIMEHRYIMEQKINRYLYEDEVVHHINHIRDDNRIENLMLLTKSEHAKLHTIERHKKIKKF